MSLSNESIQGSGQEGVFRKIWRLIFEAAYRIYVVIAVLGAVSNGAYHLYEWYLSNHAPLSSTNISGPFSWTYWIAIVCVILASIGGAWVGASLLTVFAKRLWETKRFWRSWESLAVTAYEEQRFDKLALVQSGLRCALISWVSIAASHELQISRLKDADPSFPDLAYVNAAHVCLIGIYLIAMIGMFAHNHKELYRLSIEKPQGYVNLVKDYFWQLAKWDLWFISLIWVTTWEPQKPYHLAYIVPMIATWIYDTGRERKVFAVVVAGLCARFTFAATFAMYYPAKAYPVPVLLGDVLPSILFWMGLALVLALLRYLREESDEKAKSLENALNDAKEATREEARLRKALETLGTQRGHPVFAKDTSRRFFFANEILLMKLAPFAEKKGWKLDSQGRAQWEDIKGKTDEEIGIEDPKYKESDELILENKIDHYEDFEPNFERSSDAEPMIWTRKEAIREGNNIIGIVGYALSGPPVEMQKMSLYLMDRLPIYASMKDKVGHVVWANKRHLKKLSKRIDELLEMQRPAEFEQLKGKSLQAKLKLINDGRGPLDEQLYGEAGKYYSRFDDLVIGCAQRVAETDPKKLENFDREMEQLITKEIHGGRQRDETYPENGWMECHKFPDEDHGRWVEVWKMPWWEPRFINGKSLPEVKGILVFFEDNHKTYLRRSIAWRWLDKLFQEVCSANSELLKVAIENGEPNKDLQAYADLRAPRLFRRMLLRLKTFIDEREHNPEFEFPLHSCKLGDYALVVKVLQKFSKVPIHFRPLPDEELLDVHGDDFFAIITCLLINSIEAAAATATTQVGQPIRKTPEILLQFEKKKTSIVVTITNDANAREDGGELTLRSSREDGQPGGGLFLAERLTQYLGKHAFRIDSKAGASSLEVCSVNKNPLKVRTTITIPLAAFRKLP